MPEHNPDLRARSPWSTLNGVHSARIAYHGTPIQHALAVPGSKSFTNRALILAGLADGPSTLHGILRSDDSYWCIDSLRKLGLSVHVAGDTVTIDGAGGQWPTREADLYIGAAGTTARFLPGALAAFTEGEWQMDGSTRLRERPLKPLLDALRLLGAEIDSLEEPNRLPLRIQGRGLRGGTTQISGSVSSQFLSGLLLASPYAKSPVRIQVTSPIVQHAYVHITLEMMRQFGVNVKYDEDLSAFDIEPLHYRGLETTLEADASTASYFFALAAVTQGTITVTNLSPASHQPDVHFVDVLERMGCSVQRGDTYIRVTGATQLHGGFTVSMKELSDQALTLAAIAPFADAPIQVTDVAHIREHESDRIRVVVENLSRVGVRCDEQPDGFTVYPGTPRGADLPSYDDHRVAMAFSILAVAAGDMRILDPGCVSKTCPNFFDLLGEMGVDVEFE